ncbi:hypothetical protein VSR82_36285 [Burkholderia sp. JPY481]|uniref:hypothetical protein n=1 Tax=unclassified Paraburkholderia TaxID=2615204 RepID=UPI00317DB6B0
MSPDGVAMMLRPRSNRVRCPQKSAGEPAIQQQIACGNLVNTASIFMTGRFSTAC